MKRKNLQINFKVIPSSEQHYPTCGDYWQDAEGVWQFRVSRMGNLFYEILVLVHELTEWAMCQAIGIRTSEIDRFDMKFEKERAAGRHSQSDEPGDDERAPYYYQHQCATKVERLAAEFFKVDWGAYSRSVEES